jgi:predicted nucleotidyltransferase component of viral defense system
MTSEAGLPLRLKVEIDSREHFTVLGLEKRILDIHSRWFSGSSSLLTYQLDELLGTKVRALYQRNKGRDLYDLWAAFQNAQVTPVRVIDCFLRYMMNEGHKISRAEFERNLLAKLDDPGFLNDAKPLLMNASEYDVHLAADFVMNKLACLIPGETWKGKITK